MFTVIDLVRKQGKIALGLAISMNLIGPFNLIKLYS